MFFCVSTYCQRTANVPLDRDSTSFRKCFMEVAYLRDSSAAPQNDKGGGTRNCGKQIIYSILECDGTFFRGNI